MVVIVIQVFTFINCKAMYRYGLEIKEGDVVFYDYLYADNSKEAIEFGYEKYPHADWIEISY